MINIKDLYIGEIGEFKGYIYHNNKTFIDYEKREDVSFFLKKGEYFYDIFTNRKYQILKAGEQIPADNIGLLEPKKYNEYFYDKTSSMLENDFMFSVNELKEIKQAMKTSSIFGSRKVGQILSYRKQNELEM